jgi:hypothetical protein
MAPRLIILTSYGSKKEPRYTCLCEAKASRSQRMWAEVSSFALHPLHSGLSNSPIRRRCLLGVLCPVRRPITALDCVLLKDRNLALAHRQGPEISSRACLSVSPRPRHHTQCWLTNQHLILLHISCLQTPKAGSSPTNFRTEPPLASSSAISFPRTPACSGTQYSPTARRVEISFNAFSTVEPMETLFWRPGELSKPPDYHSRCSRISLVYSEIEFHKHTPR